MNIKTILKKIFFHSKKEKGTKIASLNDFVFLPTRQNLKDKPEILILLDSYKKEYIQILYSKRIVMSQDLELEELRNLSQMYTELLFNLIGEEDLNISFENVLYYMAGTKRVEYLSKMAKLKSYFNELEQLYLKTQLHIIALQEILNEKFFLSPLKKNSIKEEINNLICTILTIKNQINAIGIEVERYLKECGKLNNEEFVSEEDIQIVINERCQELKAMISLLMPDRLKDLDDYENNITNLVIMEKILEEYIYNHKNDVESLKKIISDGVLGIKEELKMKEIFPHLKDLELKLKVFSLYGHNLINENDFKSFYSIKFASLTRNMMTIPEFDIVKDANHIEIECYINIISQKISSILTGQNIFWNKFFYNNSNATQNFISFLKSEHDRFDYWDILSSTYLLGLVVAFDRENGLNEYYSSVRLPKKSFPQINFHENTYQHSRQIRIRSDEIPFFKTKLETFDKKFLEFSDVLSLETIFRMAYYNEEDLQEPLYVIFKIMFSQTEAYESTFRLPEGLISINILDCEMSKDDIKIIELFKKLANNKDFVTPSSLEEINGPLLKDVSLKDVYLNEGLKMINQETFKGLKAKSIHIPKSLSEIGEATFSKARIYKIYFNSFMDSKLNENFGLIFCNFIKHFFTVTKVGKERYYYVSDYVREKQKAYREGRYNTFSDADLFDHDAIYQDFELRLVNCSQIIFESEDFPFIVFNEDDVKLTITRNITYIGTYSYTRYKSLSGKEEIKGLPLSLEEVNIIYNYFQQALKEKREILTRTKEKTSR